MSQHFHFPATPGNVTPKDSRCRDVAFSLHGCFPSLASIALAHSGMMLSTLWDYSRAFKGCLSATSNSGLEKEKQAPIFLVSFEFLALPPLLPCSLFVILSQISLLPLCAPIIQLMRKQQTPESAGLPHHSSRPNVQLYTSPKWAHSPLISFKITYISDFQLKIWARFSIIPKSPNS